MPQATFGRWCMRSSFIYFFFSGGLFCFNIYHIKCCDFHLSELWFKCLVEGLQGTKWKLSHQQKLWWRQQPEDRSRLNSWPLSAAMFVLVNCTQEEQPWSKEEEKLWSHIGSHSTSPPASKLWDVSVPWSESCCSLQILSYLWTPQKVLPFLCCTFHSCYSCQQRPAGPEIMWVTWLPQIPSGSQERQINPFPFWDIVCYENTTVRKSKNLK